MNWVDWVVIGIVGLSALLGFKRGMARELVSLATWVGAILLARLFGPQVSVMLEPYVEHELLRTGLGYLLTSVMVIIIGSFVGRALAGMIQVTGLGAVDRFLGIVFGAGRGVAILVVLAVVVSLTPFIDSDPWRDAQFSEPLEELRDQAMGLINEQLS